MIRSATEETDSASLSADSAAKMWNHLTKAPTQPTYDPTTLKCSLKSTKSED